MKPFLLMLIAANSAALAIYMSFMLFGYAEYVDYFACLGVFLIYRVLVFRSEIAMPLTPENVKTMSLERILWNTSTILLIWSVMVIKWAAMLLWNMSQDLL